MPFMEFTEGQYECLKLPLRELGEWSDVVLPADLMQACGYREFFDLATRCADAAVVELRAVAYADEG